MKETRYWRLIIQDRAFSERLCYEYDDSLFVISLLIFIIIPTWDDDDFLHHHPHLYVSSHMPLRVGNNQFEICSCLAVTSSSNHPFGAKTSVPLNNYFRGKLVLISKVSKSNSSKKSTDQLPKISFPFYCYWLSFLYKTLSILWPLVSHNVWY